VSEPRTDAERRQDLVGALKRDLATLAGPKCYLEEADLVAFYEERVAGYRREILAIEKTGEGEGTDG